MNISFEIGDMFFFNKRDVDNDKCSQNKYKYNDENDYVTINIADGSHQGIYFIYGRMITDM